MRLIARLPPAWVAVLAVLASACSGDQDDPVEMMREGLEHALPDEALGPSQPTSGPLPDDPLLRDPARAATPLAPFRIDSTTEYRLTSAKGDRLALVKDVVRFTQAAGGSFRSVLEREVAEPPSPDRTVGSEAVYADGRFFTRDRYGDFVERDPMREHHVEWRRHALETLPMLVGLIGPGLARSPASPTSRDGVVLERTTLSLAGGATGAPSAGDPASLRDDLATWPDFWRQVHRPTEIRGEVLTDARCGCVVEGRLLATFSGAKDDQRFTLRIDHRYTLTQLDAPPELAVPTGAVEPRRVRVTHMLREILGDLYEEPAAEE